jgi:hypothetical protein
MCPGPVSQSIATSTGREGSISTRIPALQRHLAYNTGHSVAYTKLCSGGSHVNSPKNIAKYLVFASAALLFVACANQMEPAKKALDEINTAVDSVSADAQKYVPDQLTGVQAKVAGLTASFDNKDYSAVVTGAPSVQAEVQGLASAVTAKKDEAVKAMNDEWTGLAAAVPPLVEAVKTRVDELSKARRVPKDIDLVAAKAGLADASAQWEKAQSTFKSGNVADAVTAAKDAKTKTESAAGVLKLNLSGANK